MTAETYPRLLFTEAFDDFVQFETEAKGHLGGVRVQLADGTVYPVYFYDAVRLAQDLEAEVAAGGACLAETNMIVLPRVTLGAMQASVTRLADEGYFRRAKPL